MKNTNTPSRTVELELLAIDLSSCTRCVGSLRNVEAAIDAVRGELKASGVEVVVKKTVIGSEECALEHEFVSSPTIRVNGRDLALETVESKCDSCTDLCGCDEGTDCRVWRYEGKEYTEAPKELIVEALRKELAGGGRPPARTPYPGVPENLKRFFAGKAAKAAAKSCCAPAEKSSCCEAGR